MNNNTDKKRGASVTSYGLVVGLIAVIAIAAVTGVGGNVQSLFGDVGGNLDNVVNESNNALPAPSPSPPDTTPPVFTSLLRQSPSSETTGDDTVTFRASFSEDVQNVDGSDFTVSGSSATVTSVNAVNAATYDLTLSGGNLAIFNGTVSLSLAGGQNIADLAGNALPGDPPSSEESYILSNPSSAAMYYQCDNQTEYVVFVPNIDSLTVNSIASVASGCSHYGFAPLGTSNSSGLQNWGYDSQVVKAISCYNCRWNPGSNHWHYHYTGSCIHQSGSGVAPNNSVLAGMVLNAQRSAVGCYDLDGTSSTFGNNTLEAPFKNSAACTNSSTNGAIDYSGVPDYILCASNSGP